MYIILSVVQWCTRCLCPLDKCHPIYCLLQFDLYPPCYFCPSGENVCVLRVGNTVFSFSFSFFPLSECWTLRWAKSQHLRLGWLICFDSYIFPGNFWAKDRSSEAAGISVPGFTVSKNTEILISVKCFAMCPGRWGQLPDMPFQLLSSTHLTPPPSYRIPCTVINTPPGAWSSWQLGGSLTKSNQWTCSVLHLHVLHFHQTFSPCN